MLGSFIKLKNKKIQPILVIILIGLIWITFNKSGLVVWYSLYKEKELLTQQINQLKQEELNMINHLDKLENDFDYIEYLAYSKFRMVKPGEKIYRIKDYKLIK